MIKSLACDHVAKTKLGLFFGASATLGERLGTMASRTLQCASRPGESNTAHSLPSTPVGEMLGPLKPAPARVLEHMVGNRLASIAALSRPAA